MPLAHYNYTIITTYILQKYQNFHKLFTNKKKCVIINKEIKRSMQYEEKK